MSMRLIGATTSPYVRKVRAVMAEKKLDYQFVAENVWADDTQIGASNPLGKVPCLVMDGQDAVFDSRVIVEYLDTLSPVGRLIPPSGRQRVEVKTWEALAAMSAGLADKPWCSAGVHLSLADIAVGCALGYLDFRFPELDWRARHANLAVLLDDRLMARPSFADTLPADYA